MIHILDSIFKENEFSKIGLTKKDIENLYESSKLADDKELIPLSCIFNKTEPLDQDDIEWAKKNVEVW